MAENYLIDSYDVDDSFGVHTKIVEALCEQIDTINVDKNSFNIGLFGEWGTGKSYIIRKLEKKLGENVVLLNIDVWKYNKLPLLRSILIAIQAIYKDKGILGQRGYVDKYGNTLNDILYSFRQLPKTNRLNRLLKSFLIPISILFVIISLLLINNQGVTTLSIVASFISGLSVPALLITFLFDSVTKAFEKTLSIDNEDRKIPTFSPEQFEKILTELLNKDDRKKIFVFDNIDRCQPDFAYEILSTIKTYLDRENCIFIIPCDDIAIKHYLSLHYDDKENKREFGKEFIDKLFNTYFRIPRFKEVDRDDYIRKQFKIAKFSVCENNDIIPILYHAYKGQTPRQIQRFVNDFISYYKIAKIIDKEESFLLDDIEMFTIMMSIKQVFPLVEDKIIENSECIEIYYNTNNKTKAGTTFENDKFVDFLDKVESRFNQEKSILPYIYLKETDNEALILSALRDGEKITVFTPETAKTIIKYNNQEKGELYSINSANAILNSLIEKDVLYNVRNMAGIHDFYNSIEDILEFTYPEKEHKDVMKSVLIDFIAKKDPSKYHNFFGIIEEFSLLRFFERELLISLNRSEESKELFKYIINKDVFEEKKVKEFLDNWAPDSIISSYIKIIFKSKKYNYISSELLNNMITSIRYDSDFEMQQILFRLMEIKSDEIDVEETNEIYIEEINNATSMLNNNNKTTNTDSKKIIDYCWTIYKYTSLLDDQFASIKNCISTMMQVNESIYRFMHFNIVLEKYEESEKIELFQSYILPLAPEYLNYLFTNDVKQFNAIFEIENIRNLLLPRDDCYEIIIKNCDIAWIEENYDRLLVVPMQKIKINLLTNHWSFDENSILSEKTISMYRESLDEFARDQTKYPQPNDLLDIVKIILLSFEIKKSYFSGYESVLFELFKINQPLALSIYNELYKDGNTLNPTDILKVLDDILDKCIPQDISMSPYNTLTVLFKNTSINGKRIRGRSKKIIIKLLDRRKKHADNFIFAANLTLSLLDRLEVNEIKTIYRAIKDLLHYGGEEPAVKQAESKLIEVKEQMQIQKESFIADDEAAIADEESAASEDPARKEKK